MSKKKKDCGRRATTWGALLLIGAAISAAAAAGEFTTPYEAPQTKRQEVFAFTRKPTARYIGSDKYEITFAVKGFCDATVSLVDAGGKIVRHLASGVLGRNAPPPFQKNSLAQKIYWNGKDDLRHYPKEPGKLRVRVQLGLKPTFEKLIGWSPRNLVGAYRGIAADKQGVYVLSGNNPQLRRYDRNGNYVKTIFPPAANVPIEKFKGLEKLEYEPGKWTLHSYVGHGGTPAGLPFHAGFASSVSGSGVYFPGGAVARQQVSLVNGFFTYATVGDKVESVWLYRVKTTDGSSDKQSIAWRSLSRRKGRGWYSRSDYFNAGEFARSPIMTTVSPDGRWFYASGLVIGRGYAGVYRMDTRTREQMGRKPWVGEDGKAGHDNKHFGRPAGIACDAKGRVYICDTTNNRIQVYSEKAEYLKTIKINRPEVIRVHQRTGALYVLHTDRVRGRSTFFLTKLESFKHPVRQARFQIGSPKKAHWGFSYHGVSAPLLTLDPWSSPLRLWLTRTPSELLILEERGDKFEVVKDFAAEARKTGGLSHLPFSSNERFAKVSCDPVREKLYYRNYYRFDLKTGAYETRVAFPYATDDIAFDKHGRVHVHFNPGFYVPGVGRLDPDLAYKEVPYDYGIMKAGKWKQKWLGVLPVKDQRGAKFFQDGIAVNMRGDIAEDCNIYYVPKMEDTSVAMFPNLTRGSGVDNSYEGFIREVREKQRRGETVYFVRRKPGRRLAGGTIWVFDWTGELRKENIVPGAPLINGVGLDEDGAVYFVFSSTKMVGGRAFLAGRGRVIGTGKKSYHPFTGTLAKFPAGGGEIISKEAQIPPAAWPKRPPDAAGCGWGWNSTKDTDWVLGKHGDWVKGAEWLYAGASPIVPLSCSCPNLRIYTDWYKRTFVPEAYRHSVGITDTAGNLVMHLGRYGNADSGRGPASPVKVGGDEIALAHVMYVAATDKRLVLSDSANERVIVLKLAYYATETTPIAMR